MYIHSLYVNRELLHLNSTFAVLINRNIIGDNLTKTTAALAAALADAV